MSKYLIKFEADYADEFEVHGWAVFTHNQMLAMNIMEDMVTKQTHDFHFGTNEEVEYNFSELLDSATYISEVESLTLEMLFGKTLEYGLFPDLLDNMIFQWNKEFGGSLEGSVLATKKQLNELLPERFK